MAVLERTAESRRVHAFPIAQLYARMGQLDRAAAAYRANPQPAVPTADIKDFAITFVNRREFQLAAGILEARLANGPRPAELLELVARIQAEVGNFDAATELLIQAAENNPFDHPYLIGPDPARPIATLLPALFTGSDASASNPRYAVSRTLMPALARLHERLSETGRTAPLVARIEARAARSPEQLCLQEMLAILCLLEKQPAKAASVGQQILERFPNHHEAQLVAAGVLVEAGEYKRALPLYEGLWTVQRTTLPQLEIVLEALRYEINPAGFTPANLNLSSR